MKISRHLGVSWIVLTLVACLLIVVVVIADLSTCASAVADAPRALERPLIEHTSPIEISALNPDPPDEVAKLVFIHHSIGKSWLNDDYGDLGAALGANNYYVSDTYYWWGPTCPECIECKSSEIGSCTDTGHWYNWFLSSNRDVYLGALYNNNDQRAIFTRPMVDPGGENEVVMFKSCFPNSRLRGSPDDPPTMGDNPLRGQPWDGQVDGEYVHTVGNAKGIYNDLLEYFETRQDKLFIAITTPPDLGDAYAANARALHNWLVHDWLDDYPYHNVAVFDLFTVLTTNGGDPDTNDLGWSTGNHHRVVTTTGSITIEHIVDGDDDDSPHTLEYPTDGGTNKHPSVAGMHKATGEFVPLLNVYYNCWKHGDCWDNATDWISISALIDTADIYPGMAATFPLSLTSSEGFTAPVTLTLRGAPSETAILFDANPITAPGTSQLYVTTTVAIEVGTYAMTVTGTSDQLTNTTSLILSIQPTLTLSAQPAVQTVLPGETAAYTLSVAASKSYAAPVTLALQGAPSETTILLDPNPITPPLISQLYITTTDSTVAETCTLTVTGASGVLSDTVGLALIVTSAAPSFTLSISPTTHIAKPNQVVSFTTIVTGLNGFARPVTLSIVGLPADVGAMWSINPVMPGNYSILNLSILSDSPFGDHVLHVVGATKLQTVVKTIGLMIEYPFKYYLPVVLKKLLCLCSRSSVLLILLETAYDDSAQTYILNPVCNSHHWNRPPDDLANMATFVAQGFVQIAHVRTTTLL